MERFGGPEGADHDQSAVTTFAIDHIYFNAKQSVTTVNNTPDPIHGCRDYSVDAAKVDDVLAKYIGPHQKGGLPVRFEKWDSGAYYLLENGKYYFSMSDNSSLTL